MDTVDPASQEAVNLLAQSVIYALVIIFYLIPNVISTAIFFKKAGRPWWAALIPGYSNYTMARIGQRSAGFAWTYFAVSIASIVLPSGIKNILGIPLIVLALMTLRTFIMQYDKKIGFWILYIFLPFIAVFMTKSAHYVGPVDKKGVHIYPPVPAPVPSQGGQPAQPYDPAQQYAAAPAPQSQPGYTVQAPASTPYQQSPAPVAQPVAAQPTYQPQQAPQQVPQPYQAPQAQQPAPQQFPQTPPQAPAEEQNYPPTNPAQ